MSQRVLLLGANGFLGRHVARTLETDEAAAPVLVRHSRDGIDEPDTGYVALDLLAADDEALAGMLRRTNPDVVVNAVGAVGGDPGAMSALNAALPDRLAATCGARGPGIRLVHIGSSAEYGAVPPGTSIAEEAPVHPVSEYGRTKLDGTTALLKRAETGVDVCVLRVFNPVGPGAGQSSLPGRAAEVFREAVATGARSVEFGPLGVYRDFVDVRDVADAVALAALLPMLGHPVLNVGSGRAVLAREMVRALAAVAGFEGSFIERAAPSTRSGGVEWQEADLTRIRTDLGWVPRRSLTEALTALWASQHA